MKVSIPKTRFVSMAPKVHAWIKQLANPVPQTTEWLHRCEQASHVPIPLWKLLKFILHAKINLQSKY
jgi:hypothetical protein